MAKERAVPRRKARKAAEVAERVAKFLSRNPVPQGARVLVKNADASKQIELHPLNPGFFLLERMRSENVAKARARAKQKVRSGR